MPPSTNEAVYELRGFFGIGTQLEVSLKNSVSGKSDWYKVGETKNGLRVERADAKAGIAVVSIHGKSRTIRLSGESPGTSDDLEFKARAVRRLKLFRFMESLSEKQCKAMKDSMGKLTAEIFKNHPDYLEKNRANDPEVKAAWIAVYRQGVMEGLAAESPSGKPAAPPPEFELASQEVIGALNIRADDKGITVTDADGTVGEMKRFMNGPDAVPFTMEELSTDATRSMPTFLTLNRMPKMSDELMKEIGKEAAKESAK